MGRKAKTETEVVETPVVEVDTAAVEVAEETPTAAPVENEAVRAGRVFNLTIELMQIMSNKKATVGGFNDEIKRIKAEIAEIVGDEA